MCRVFVVIAVVLASLCAACGPDVCRANDVLNRPVFVLPDRWETRRMSSSYAPTLDIDVYPRTDGSPFLSCRYAASISIEGAVASFAGDEFPILDEIGALIGSRDTTVDGLETVTAIDSVTGFDAIDGLSSLRELGDIDVGRIGELPALAHVVGDLTVEHGRLDLPALAQIDGTLRLDRTRVDVLAMSSLRHIGARLQITANAELATFTGFAEQTTVGESIEIVGNQQLSEAAMRDLIRSGALTAPSVTVCDNGFANGCLND